MKKKGVKEVTLTANAKSEDMNYNFSVGLYIFKEGDSYIAYAPTFDLSSYAETSNEAIAAFYEAFQMHIEYCVEQNTLIADLKAHGWSVETQKVKEPSLMELLKNSVVGKIISGGVNYQYISSPVSIPACAL